MEYTAANEASSRIREYVETRRGNAYAPECPSRALLDHVTSRWGVLVMVVLQSGPHRFSELTTAIGDISDKMLSQTLKTLVADGFIARVVSDETPVRVSYHLTEPGHEASVRLADFVHWLECNIGSLSQAADRPVHSIPDRATAR